MKHHVKRISFIVDSFPQTTETFVINQIADLIDRGIEVDVFAFARGASDNISDRYAAYGMQNRVRYLTMPKSLAKRLVAAIPSFARLLFRDPKLAFRTLDPRRGRDALSLKLLFRCEPFAGKRYDLIHCHYGKIANRYLAIRDVLGQTAKLVVSFYGYDVSQVFRIKPPDYYDRLKQEASAFIVMSGNMKQRVVAYGFAAEKVHVIPAIGIDVESYPFAERRLVHKRPVRVYSVGRLVEKKGFDDLLRATALAREHLTRPFTVEIVGDGPLKNELDGLSKSLKVNDIVKFHGFKKIEDIIQDFLTMDLYVQPSKTARNGDME